MDVIKAFFEALKIKFEVTHDSPYDPDFVAKIENSRKQATEGKTVKIDLDDSFSQIPRFNIVPGGNACSFFA